MAQWLKYFMRHLFLWQRALCVLSTFLMMGCSSQRPELLRKVSMYTQPTETQLQELTMFRHFLNPQDTPKQMCYNGPLLEMVEPNLGWSTDYAKASGLKAALGQGCRQSLWKLFQSLGPLSHSNKSSKNCSRLFPHRKLF